MNWIFLIFFFKNQIIIMKNKELNTDNKTINIDNMNDIKKEDNNIVYKKNIGN